jgi:hypothetical protein
VRSGGGLARRTIAPVERLSDFTPGALCAQGGRPRCPVEDLPSKMICEVGAGRMALIPPLRPLPEVRVRVATRISIVQLVDDALALVRRDALEDLVDLGFDAVFAFL